MATKAAHAFRARFPATATITRKLISINLLNNRVFTPVSSDNSVKCYCENQKRWFRPYSRVPKQFLKPKNRDKINRDDVYFLKDQTLPSYTIDETIDILKAYDLFGKENIDLILKLNMGEGKKKIGALKGLVHLPNPITAAQKVLVFAEGEDAVKAKEAGAAIVGGNELIKQIEDGDLEFDHCLSTLSFLPNIKNLSKILRNKMPNTRRGTATDDILGALEKYSHGESYTAGNDGVMRQTIAITDFSGQHIRENLFEMLKVIDSHKTTSSEKFYEYVGVMIPPGPQLNIKMSEILSEM